MANTFRIVHITDLHIGAHDDSAWRALTEAINESKPNLIVISGDLSESNNLSDMECVCTWITGKVTSRASMPSFGLDCGKSYRDKVVIIPGNHDYFFGDLLRVQRGKNSNINDLHFSQVFDVETYPNWRFIDRGDSPGLYIVSIDSAKELSIAKGVIEKSALEKIRKWSDKARCGNLTKGQCLLGIPGLNEDQAIKKYSVSYKVIVTHHYLTSPAIIGYQPFMALHNNHEILGQITSDNFDLILSGHDHLGFFDSCSYASLLEARAMARFARMHCVRRLRVRKPRVYEADENNRLLSKPMRIAIDLWNRCVRNAEDKIHRIYRFGDNNPINKSVRNGYAEFVKYDLKDRDIRFRLQQVADRIKNEIENILRDRNIVNAIGYSATARGAKSKGFFIFDINDENQRAGLIHARRWLYDENSYKFKEAAVRELSISQPLDFLEANLTELIQGYERGAR